MKYSIEARHVNGSMVICRGFSSNDNMLASAARCAHSGQFAEIWIYVHRSNGERANGIRYYPYGFNIK